MFSGAPDLLVGTEKAVLIYMSPGMWALEHKQIFGIYYNTRKHILYPATDIISCRSVQNCEIVTATTLITTSVNEKPLLDSVQCIPLHLHTQ